MINALWFPPNSGSADVRPWDANDQQTPRAHGDYCSNTATDYGLMLAYNQFSGNSALQSSGHGRLRPQRGTEDRDPRNRRHGQPGHQRAGHQRRRLPVLLQHRAAGFVPPSGTSPRSRPSDVATRICAWTPSGGKACPATPRRRKPVLIHCIAFGAIFEPTASGSEQANAVAFLQQLSTIGGTTFPSSASDPANGYKWCIGTWPSGRPSCNRRSPRSWTKRNRSSWCRTSSLGAVDFAGRAGSRGDRPDETSRAGFPDEEFSVAEAGRGGPRVAAPADAGRGQSLGAPSGEARTRRSTPVSLSRLKIFPWAGPIALPRSPRSTARTACPRPPPAASRPGGAGWGLAQALSSLGFTRVGQNRAEQSRRDG